MSLVSGDTPTKIMFIPGANTSGFRMAPFFLLRPLLEKNATKDNGGGRIQTWEGVNKFQYTNLLLGRGAKTRKYNKKIVQK
jgi:hypothetical protein